MKCAAKIVLCGVLCPSVELKTLSLVHICAGVAGQRCCQRMNFRREPYAGFFRFSSLDNRHESFQIFKKQTIEFICETLANTN